MSPEQLYLMHAQHVALQAAAEAERNKPIIVAVEADAPRQPERHPVPRWLH
jgi:hypothetical protein